MTEPASRRLVVVSAGLGQPSSTRLLTDRLATATERSLAEAGLNVQTETIEVRDYAQDLVNHVLTGFPSAALEAAIRTVKDADGLIAASPVFTASYSGLFKLFFDVLDRGSLAGMPVLIGATAGTPRHSLVLDHALRPLFAYLSATVLPTGVFAASQDWGREGTETDPALAERIQRAGAELAAAIAVRPRNAQRDPFDDPVPFDQLLGGGPSDRT